jgi:rhamnogalacturonyl hydrolase YesR
MRTKNDMKSLLLFPCLWFSFTLGTTVTFTGCASDEAIESPREHARNVADRLVEETTFGFVPVLSSGIQEGAHYIDFFDGFDASPGGIYYAHANVKFDRDPSEQPVYIGVSHSSGDLLIRINNEEVYRNRSESQVTIRGLDYDILEYETVTPVDLQDGENEVLIKMRPTGPEEARMYLGFIGSDGRHRRDVVLTPVADPGLPVPVSFLAIGPFSGGNRGIDTIHPPDTVSVSLGTPASGLDGKDVFWNFPRVHLVSQLPDPLDYADWRYFTGTFLDALDEVSRAFSGLDYYAYIDTHIEFFLDHYRRIETERKAYGLLRTPYGHFFRFSLLDDIGMQGVPIIERLGRMNERDFGKTHEWSIVERIAGHIMHDALRLDDGTFCRINPDSMTIWADDLFMGTVFLIRLTRLTGDRKYLDEAVRQTLLFDAYLQDDYSGLYRHGWFSRTAAPSSSTWGRANGWVMMAKTELLRTLSDTHPLRPEILDGFRKQAEGIRRVQSTDGRWHQVLDNPKTYLETSATAMFVRAFAEGLINDWLTDGAFRTSAIRGWNAVARQIRDDGMVEGIVRGTPIMFADGEYDAHPPRLNDPRGLGAVLYAAAAMQRLVDHEPE